MNQHRSFWHIILGQLSVPASGPCEDREVRASSRLRGHLACLRLAVPLTPTSSASRATATASVEIPRSRGRPAEFIVACLPLANRTQAEANRFPPPRLTRSERARPTGSRRETAVTFLRRARSPFVASSAALGQARGRQARPGRRAAPVERRRACGDRRSVVGRISGRLLEDGLGEHEVASRRSLAQPKLLAFSRAITHVDALSCANHPVGSCEIAPYRA
jgi:hypothetical protein